MLVVCNWQHKQELSIPVQRDPLQHPGAGVALYMERGGSEAFSHGTAARPRGLWRLKLGRLHGV